MRELFFRYIGNISFRLNGGLENLNNNSYLDKLTIWAWSKAWYYGEKTAGRI